MKLFSAEFPQVFTGEGRPLIREMVFPEAFHTPCHPGLPHTTHRAAVSRRCPRNGCSYEKGKTGLTDGFQSLAKVCNNVFRGFRPYGKADEVGPDARFHKLFIR